MTSFEALLISKAETGQTVEWKTLSDADLMDGDVTVRVTHSTINYKDGLAITGKAPVVRRWPMIPGVDFAGVVSASTNPDFAVGDDVVATGCGLGEMHYGGYAQYARVHGEWLHKVPSGLTRADCMAIGTAGITAMLSVMALEAHGLEPGDGPILVTGATGGVGSVSVALLAKLGYSVIASTGKLENAEVLKLLGASEVIARSELAGKPRPLATERWAGAVDVVGSATLANVLSHTKYGGVVAACGLVQGIDLPTTVAPFILRGVTLAGIESVMVPRAKRAKAWERLAQDLDLARLHAMTETRPMKDVALLASLIVAGKVKGRVVFEMPQPVETAQAVEEVEVAAPVEAEVAAPAEAEAEAEVGVIVEVVEPVEAAEVTASAEVAASVEVADATEGEETGAAAASVENIEAVEAAESEDVVAAATEAPAAEEPVAEAPILEELATEEPVEEELVLEEPVAAEPMAEEPASEEPAAAEPVAEEPILEEAAAEEPVAEESVLEEPVAEEPVAEEPTPEEPAAEVTASEASAAEEPATETPSDEPESTTAEIDKQNVNTTS
jgi:acrylyl-CoA reductase (NADPH)